MVRRVWKANGKSIREIHENERKSREQILTFAERHYRCTVKRNGLKINNTIQMYIYTYTYGYTCRELEERWLAACITGLHVNFQCVVYVGYIIR